jgi:hypothetical protein
MAIAHLRLNSIAEDPQKHALYLNRQATAGRRYAQKETPIRFGLSCPSKKATDPWGKCVFTANLGVPEKVSPPFSTNW